jgi:hypothetical protein
MKVCVTIITASLSVYILGLFLLKDITGLVSIPQLPTSSGGVNQRGAKYIEIATVIWEVNGRGAKAEAKLEVLENEVSSGNLPFARLKIMNLVTSKVIFEKEYADSPISMFVRDLNGDSIKELIVNWEGGSASRLEILEVNVDSARVILYESYRVDAALIDLSGKGIVDILITTAESGVGPFYTTRYVWRGREYRSVGRVPYAKLRTAINRAFD